MFNTGGGHNNVNPISTQVLLIYLFIQLNLNMLVAVHCCPIQSWVNLAMRIMSILNLALQNCSLEWGQMFGVLEQKIKQVSSRANLRNLMESCVNLHESFMESINPVKEIVNIIFESMSLKDEKINKFKNLLHLKMWTPLQSIFFWLTQPLMLRSYLVLILKNWRSSSFHE